MQRFEWGFFLLLAGIVLALLFIIAMVVLYHVGKRRQNTDNYSGFVRSRKRTN